MGKLLAGFLITLLTCPFTSLSSPIPQAELRAWYDSLAHPLLDENLAAKIVSVSVVRGGQKIIFTRGSMHIFRPVRGHYFGCVFTGTGMLVVAPPTTLEQKEFERQTGISPENGNYTFPFTRAVLWFQDSVMNELRPNLSFQQQKVEREEGTMVERSVDYGTDPTMDNVLYHLIGEALAPNPLPFLFGHFFPKEGREIFLKYDLRRFEEVEILRPPYESITGSVWWLEIVNTFHLPEEYAASDEYRLSKENKRAIDILYTNIDLDIEKSGNVKAKAVVYFSRKTPLSPAGTFYVDQKFSIDSVTTRNGQHIAFLRTEKSDQCLVMIPNDSTPKQVLVFYYTGMFLSLNKPMIYSSGRQTIITSRIASTFYEMSSSTGWYPDVSYGNWRTFDVTYHVPEGLQLVGAGSLQEQSSQGGKTVLHYVTTEPTGWNSFSLGYYKETDHRESDTTPSVRVYDIPGGEPEKVAIDISNALKLYGFLFGALPYQELRATPSTSAFRGEAFAEFIKLPWFEEQVGSNDNASTIIGRAHEVAHMWWGLGVKPASYHDAWISEAFAQYSSLLYARLLLKRDDVFFEKLRDWKNLISGERKFAFGSGPPLGSIWLGFRASTTQTENDYSLATYRKGAWVLHMLRMMMVDLTTLKEDAFKSMMAEFYQTRRNKDTSTDDFIAIVNKYFHTDMHWFFNQWVYGTEIPTLKCEKSITKTPAGKYALHITIQQKDVSAPFTIFLPVEVKYKNGNVGRVRLLVDEARKEFTYEVDQEPDDVKFNIMESVLCNIEE